MTGYLRTSSASASNVQLLIQAKSWSGPFDPATSARAMAALEAGRVLVLPNLGFQVAPAEAALLDERLPTGRRKNISLDPALDPADGPYPALAAMIRRFAGDTTRLVRTLCPAYASTLETARTSFRPAEIAGRAYSPRQDDRRLHIDAFPSRPLFGNRILRVFSNLSPTGRARRWHIGEPFEDLAARLLPFLPPASPTRARLYAMLGLTKGVRAPYDQLMLALHDRMKRDDAYQAAAAFTPISFAAGTSWMCFTDQVPHAAISGHLTLEQTFHLQVTAMADPGRSPLRVLERLTGQRLA